MSRSVSRWSPRQQPPTKPSGEEATLPVFDVDVFDEASTADACVVDQDVELAEGADCGLDDLLPVLLLRHVQSDEDGLTAGLIDLRFDLTALVFQDVAYGDLGALASK